MDFPEWPTISRIHIRVYSDWICLYLAGNLDEISIDYEKRDTGCVLNSWEGRERHMRNLDDQDFLNVASGDIQRILEDQTTILKELAVVMLYKPDEERYLNPTAMKIFEKVEEIFKSRKTRLQVQHLTITAIGEHQVMQILPQLNPKSLKRLTINNANEPNQQMDREVLSIEKIRNTEQFKNSEELAIMGFFIEKTVDSLEGFKSLQVAFENLTNELLQEIRKVLLQWPNFGYIQIRFGQLGIDVEKNLEISYGLPSGETDQLGHKRRQWFLSTEDHEKVESIIVFRENILGSLIEREKVFDGAKVV